MITILNEKPVLEFFFILCALQFSSCLFYIPNKILGKDYTVKYVSTLFYFLIESVLWEFSIIHIVHIYISFYCS